VTGYTA
jgi:hypothetical protein